MRFVQHLQQDEQQPPQRQEHQQWFGTNDGDAAEQARQQLLRQAEQVAAQVATHPNWIRKLRQLSSCEPSCPCAKDPSQAAQERRLGNECFALAQYRQALQHYSLALRHSIQPPQEQQKGQQHKEEEEEGAAARRSCSTLHANRAACLLALQRWTAAAEESTEALRLWRENSKALFRRSKVTIPTIHRCSRITLS